MPTGGNLAQLVQLSTASTTEARLRRLLHQLKPLRKQQQSALGPAVPLVIRLMMGALGLLVRAMLFTMKRGKAVFIEQILADLAVELGIPEDQLTGYRSLEREPQDPARFERVPPRPVA